ncbi:MAG: endonuclease domain-containing protein [Clostridia bacterium]|nr:endonuclease domain-containing protein [Clostridia bacterium]
MQDKKVLVERAHRMRKEPTEEENKLWHILLKKIRPRFLRQRVIGNYIVDFCCPKLKLIIEVDGEQHYLPENENYERTRTTFLEEKGYKVLRFYNSDINKLIRNIELSIVDICKERAEEIGKDVVVEFIK